MSMSMLSRLTIVEFPMVIFPVRVTGRETGREVAVEDVALDFVAAASAIKELTLAYAGAGHIGVAVPELTIEKSSRAERGVEWKLTAAPEATLTAIHDSVIPPAISLCRPSILVMWREK